MIKKIIFLVGLCGSGKTTWANKHLSDDVLFIDDLVDINHLYSAAKFNEVVAIVDIHLCYSSQRRNAVKLLTARYPEILLEWYYWENNIKKAWNNVKARDDGRPISRIFMKHLSECYKPPSANVIEIYEAT